MSTTSTLRTKTFLVVAIIATIIPLWAAADIVVSDGGFSLVPFVRTLIADSFSTPYTAFVAKDLGATILVGATVFWFNQRSETRLSWVSAALLIALTFGVGYCAGAGWYVYLVSRKQS